MVDLAASGYTVDDLDWLRDEIGVARIELDPWGSPILSPETEVGGEPVRFSLPA